jgi:hypothetical protein
MVKVTSVERVQPRNADKVAQPAEPDKRLYLGDRIAVHIENMDQLFATPECASKVALFLNGQALKGVTPIRSGEKDVLQFDFGPTSQSSSLWKEIFLHPFSGGRNRPVSFNVGFLDQGPLASDPVIREIDLFPPGWTGLFIGVFFALLTIFSILARRSGILRDAPPPLETIAAGEGKLNPALPPPEAGPYSLARAQGAWWLFIILAAYAFIGIVTGDFVSSLSSTAVILLGIGAGTVLGGTVISQSKRDDQVARAQKLEIKAMDLAELQRLRAASTTAPLSGADLARYNTLATTYSTALTLKDSGFDELVRRSANDYAVATNQGSGNFLLDILSDADGVNFARFQLFAWTIVLGVVFIVDVVQYVAMPVFDTTLMALLGLSAGTYLGLKIPEPTVPKQSGSQGSQ